MNTSIEFEFELTSQDYRKAIRDFYLHQMRTWVIIVVTGALCLLGILFVSDFGLSAEGLFLVLLLPLSLVLYFVYSPYQMGRRASRNERFTTMRRWVVTEREIKVTSKFSESKFDWGVFMAVIESKEYYLLRSSTNKNLFTIIPKRVFGTRQMAEEFRCLVIRNIEKV